MSPGQTEQILEVISDHVSDYILQQGPVTLESKLENLKIDSLDMVEIIFAIEDKIGLTLPFNANIHRGKFKTIGDVVTFVESVV